MRFAQAVMMTAPPPPAPPDTEFGDPSGASWVTGGNTVSPITTGEVTASAGDRLVLLFSGTRGSIGTPQANPALLSITGTGDFSALDGTDFTDHQTQTFRDDGNGRGGIVSGRSLVLGSGGTGAMAVAWSPTPFGSSAILLVLPPCSLIASAKNAVNNAATSLVITLGGTPAADDLLVGQVCQPNQSTTPGVPSGWFSLGSHNITNTAHRAGFQNGGAAAANSWGSISGAHPAGGVVLQFRKTV